ncbi:MAG: DGQHR domain-containing protein [bacterium]|nr:DGQHR domain-containing protein [bacterium]
MASVLPAMKGTFGSTEYYIVTMKAEDVTNRLKIPRDIEEWEDLSIEERYQREIQYGRVKRQIAPYLAEDEDRFFGAFIVTMLYADDLEFEPLSRVYKDKVPSLYRTAANDFGFLTFSGSEILVPLDGQHRLAALQFAITGKDEKSQPIQGLQPATHIAQDVCTLILIKHDAKKSRKIFNKVNRYAKRTTKTENLITADDDIVAVIVREAVIGTDNAIPYELVNATSNTLTTRAREFTTLSTLYESTKYFLEDTHGKINVESLPDKSKQKIMRQDAKVFWDTICSSINLFTDALQDPSETGDNRRREIRSDYLLGKPIAQWALVQGLVLLRQESKDGAKMSLEDACKRANQLSWRTDDGRWQQVLMNGDRVGAGKTTVNYASRVIAYWLGNDFTEQEIVDLKDRYISQGGIGKLAEPIIND